MPSNAKTRIANRTQLGIAVICFIIGIILIALGAKSLQPSERTKSKDIVVDYTNCTQHIFNQPEIRCIDYNLTSPVCVCQHQFVVPEPLIGNITLYYELDSNVQTGDSYINSRDDQQLSGQLFQEPAEECDPYRFDDSGKPIAPCGEIADSMFTDKYLLRRPGAQYMNVTYYGMIKKDMTKYHNPPWNKSYPLKDAFNDFAKPKSWSQHIWELDPDNPDNNGFENERFIGWMTTTMKRKPAWRLDSSYSVPNGSYVLRVEYSYPPSKYNGTRKVILVASLNVLDYGSYGGGVAMVVLGVISLVLSLVLAGYNIMLYLNSRRETRGAGDAFGGLMN
ncbi:cell cycle control protein 50A-like [Plodia interpunctella]|uniref:cell cycle control protein 50A-like n=1 Tax=Plodia interpunctella TaxID=58824 RepID=UPI0023682F54|nr:cell cycle control protein 50A-like [Plodia interpunctella]